MIMYLAWYDDSNKKDAATKIREAVEVYTRRFDSTPTIVLVNSLDQAVHIDGMQVEVDDARIRPNNFQIGRELMRDAHGSAPAVVPAEPATTMSLHIPGQSALRAARTGQRRGESPASPAEPSRPETGAVTVAPAGSLAIDVPAVAIPAERQAAGRSRRVKQGAPAEPVTERIAAPPSPEAESS